MKIYKINDIVSLPKPVLCYAGIFEQTPDPDIEWAHRHDYYSMVWLTHGKGFNVIDFQEYEIIPARVFMMNPQQIHNWKYTTDTRGYFLLFEKALATQLAIEFRTPYTDFSPEEIPLAEIVWRRMTNEKDEKKLSVALLYLLSLLKQESVTASLHTTVFNYKKLLTETIHTNISVNECAEQLGVSPDRLNLLCKEQTGLSAKQLQLDLKITEAKRLLLHTPLSVSEIAFHLGFEDPSYFARIFREKTLSSPSSFRENYLKKT